MQILNTIFEKSTTKNAFKQFVLQTALQKISQQFSKNSDFDSTLFEDFIFLSNIMASNNTDNS